MSEIQLKGSLSRMSKEFRILVLCFVFLLNVGFFTGFNFVRVTTAMSPSGIESNYLGNEEDQEAEVMQFKKSHREILTLIHNHILSLSIVFFVLGLLFFCTRVDGTMRSILLFEPFLSLILTFGGIYVLWSGIAWFTYVIMISGMAMVVSVILLSFFIIRDCLIPAKS